jgi:hypothetical protein
MSIIIVFGLAIILTALLIAFYLHTRSRERKIMLEYGLDPSLINLYSKKSSGGVAFLFIGIILLGVATGISTGVFLAQAMKMPGETKELVILCLIISIAVSCILCFYLSRHRNSD